MATNLDGNEIGVIIEADNLLVQIAKARLMKAKKPVKKPEAKKPVTESRPRTITKPAETKKA